MRIKNGTRMNSLSLTKEVLPLEDLRNDVVCFTPCTKESRMGYVETRSGGGV